VLPPGGKNLYTGIQPLRHAQIHIPNIYVGDMVYAEHPLQRIPEIKTESIQMEPEGKAALFGPVIKKARLIFEDIPKSFFFCREFFHLWFLMK
jgi:hypothetical protein